MTVLTPTQATQYAKNAGFTGTGLITIVAIATAESGLNTAIRGKTDSRDRGILQINSFWHPEVSDSCAFDPACAFQQGYRISAKGTNFNQWVTFTNGDYKAHLAQSTGNSTPLPQPTTPTTSSGDILGTVKAWGEYIAIFFLALGLIVIGFFLLDEKQAMQAAQVAAKAVLA